MEVFPINFPTSKKGKYRLTILYTYPFVADVRKNGKWTLDPIWDHILLIKHYTHHCIVNEEKYPKNGITMSEFEGEHRSHPAQLI